MKPLIFKNQAGAAAVEFAVILPFLVLLILGTIDLSCLIYNKHILTLATRVAARQTITWPEDAASAVAVVVDFCNDKMINWNGGSTSITVTPDIAEVNVKAYRSVTVTFEYNPLLDGFLGFNMGNKMVVGKSMMGMGTEDQN